MYADVQTRWASVLPAAAKVWLVYRIIGGWLALTGRSNGPKRPSDTGS